VTPGLGGRSPGTGGETPSPSASPPQSPRAQGLALVRGHSGTLAQASDGHVDRRNVWQPQEARPMLPLGQLSGQEHHQIDEGEGGDERGAKGYRPGARP
jgi:hypothetical protein